MRLWATNIGFNGHKYILKLLNWKIFKPSTATLTTLSIMCGISIKYNVHKSFGPPGPTKKFQLHKKFVFNFSYLFSFSDEISRYHPINKNAFKPPVDEKIKEIVRKNFTKEIEFYEFCKQRLHKQYIALKLPKK